MITPLAIPIRRSHDQAHGEFISRRSITVQNSLRCTRQQQRSYREHAVTLSSICTCLVFERTSGYWNAPGQTWGIPVWEFAKGGVR